MKKKKKEVTETKTNGSGVLKIALIIIFILLIIGLIVYFLYKKKIITIQSSKYNFNGSKNQKNINEMGVIDNLKINDIDDYPIS